MKQLIIACLTLLCAVHVFAQSAGEVQAARQARSVHLHYRHWQGPASVFYLETTPEQVVPGTYICSIGFDCGYCGIQELFDGSRIAIFSVWEPNATHNPNVVKEEERTKLLYAGKEVHVQRFGGEGTGGKSMVPWKWELDKPVQLAVSVTKDGEKRAAYTCWIWDESQQGWFRMATFSTLLNNGRSELKGPYSFVEDFRRNVKSKDVVRKSRFSRLWAFNGHEWSASTEASFTADDNLLTTIDAGPSKDGFWLATGGDTTNVTTKLWESIKPGDASEESAARRLQLLTEINNALATP